MVILNAIQGERVYLDTNIFIYALEGYPDFVDELTELFESLDSVYTPERNSELKELEWLNAIASQANLHLTRGDRVLELEC